MSSEEGSRDFWRVIAAYLLPPLGVFMQVGVGVPFWINLVLTFLGYIPGQIHAVWVIATRDEHGRADAGMRTFISLLVGFFLPPVGVLMRSGVGMALLVNIVLCFFFWIPGQLHALWVITHEE